LQASISGQDFSLSSWISAVQFVRASPGVGFFSIFMEPQFV
jgi:hypothetical protein